MPERLMELQYPPRITVTGHGEVNARPDEATVQLGVQAQAETAAAAQDAVNTAMQKVLKNIKQAGVAEESIQTSGLNLTPVYAPLKPGQESELPPILGYRAANTIRIEVKDLAHIGKVVDAGLKAGANRLEGISFRLQNELPYRIQALEQAAAEAKAKGKTLAAALGVKIVGVGKVQEGQISLRRPLPMPMMAARAAAEATPVEAGQLKVEATITVEYDIAPLEQKKAE